MHKQSRACPRILLLLLGSACALSAYPAEPTLETIKNLELAKIDAGVQTQERINQLDDQRLTLVSDYQTTLRQISDLEAYNTNLRGVIDSQEQEIASLRQQINRVGNLERDVVPLMNDMVNALEEFIHLDLPFLTAERQRRLENLRTLLTQNNVSNAERYRRILEAYQIENDYGRTIETYQGTVNNHGTDLQTVNFLKLGRIAFLYQTVDGQSSYRWSQQAGDWVPLENGYNSQIARAIKMAKEQIPSDLLRMPIVAPPISSREQ